MGLIVEQLIARLPTLVAALLFLAIGVTMLALNARHAPTRAFSAFLIIRGLERGIFATLAAFEEPELRILALRVDGWSDGLEAIAMLAFILVFPWPRTRLKRVGLMSIGLAALYVLASAVFPVAAFGEYAVSGATVTRVAGGEIALTGVCMLYVMMGVIIFLLARDLPRMETPLLRRASLLVLTGFGLFQIYAGALFIFNDIEGSIAYVSRYARATYVVRELAILLPLAAVALLLRHAAKHPELARPFRLASTVLLVPVLHAAITVFAFDAPLPLWVRLSAGLFELSFALLVGYALLKCQLFDVDLKIKWTIRRGAVAAIFLVVFLIVAQLGQNFLSARYGWVLGGIATGAMLFVIHPIQRVAERIANTAMPGVADTPEYRSTRKLDVFRATVRTAFADRILTREEERMLADLAEELGIGAGQAFTIREEVEREMGTA